jgi:hypothetical protein
MSSSVIKQIAEILADAILRGIEGETGLRSRMERSIHAKAPAKLPPHFGGFNSDASKSRCMRLKMGRNFGSVVR